MDAFTDTNQSKVAAKDAPAITCRQGLNTAPMHGTDDALARRCTR